MDDIVSSFLISCAKKKVALIGALKNDGISKIEERYGLAIVEPALRHVAQPHAEGVAIKVDGANDYASPLRFPAPHFTQSVAMTIASRAFAKLVHEDDVTGCIGGIGVFKALVTSQFSF